MILPKESERIPNSSYRSMLCCEYIIFAFQEKSFSLNGRLRSSHAWYRSRSQWLCITGAKIHDSKTKEGATEEAPHFEVTTTTCCHATVRRETACSYGVARSVKLQLRWWPWRGQRFEATISPWLSRHCDASRTSSSQSSNVTSKHKQDLRMLKPLSAPIKPDRSWVSLPTHNPREEHQARKEQFMLAQDKASTTING